MKAKIVREKAVNVWGIDNDCPISRRLVVEEADDLAIKLLPEGLVTFTNFDSKDCEVLGEVEVPDELIEKALVFVRAKKELDNLKESFEALFQK